VAVSRGLGAFQENLVDGRDPVPVMLSSADVGPVLEEVREGARKLRSIPAEEIIERLGPVVSAWLQPKSPWMEMAQARLPAATGFHPAMIAHALPFQLEALTPSSLRLLVERELGSLAVLDRPDWPQRLVVHVMAGNIPGLAGVTMVLGVVAKQATVVKPAMGDPLFPYLFHQSLRVLDPDLAGAVAVIGWRGGSSAVEELVFAEADVVVAMGGKETMSALQKRLGRKLRAYGPRLSFAVIARECLCAPGEARGWARALAYDTTLWDQRGCLSPQIAFVENGGKVDVMGFAEMVASALGELCAELPPRTLELEEQVAVRAFRDEGEWDPLTHVLASAGDLSWTVAVEPQPRFLPTPQHRCLRVQSVGAIEEIGPLVAPHRHLLEGVGVAAPPQRWASLDRWLRSVGVHWVTPLGSMQRPSLEWRPGGRDRIKEWV